MAGQAQARVALGDFAAFVASALFLDRDDPVAGWGELSPFQDALIDRLKGARELRIEADGTNLCPDATAGHTRERAEDVAGCSNRSKAEAEEHDAIWLVAHARGGRPPGGGASPLPKLLHGAYLQHLRRFGEMTVLEARSSTSCPRGLD